MAINLANLYAFMQKTVSDCSIIYRLPTTYLQTLTGRSDKVIFVCEEDKRSLKLNNGVSPSKINIKQDDDQNLTGSPLRDDCHVDTIDMSIDLKPSSKTPWSSEEEHFKGLDIDFARSLLCDFDLIKESTSSQGAVWILCDGSDYDRNVLLEIEFDKNSFTRGIVNFEGIIPTNAIKSQDIFNRHMSVMGSKPKINTQIDCVFSIKPNISFKVSWSTSALNPSLNNLKNSDIVLCQTFSPNECALLTEDLFNQLRILAYIKDDIVEFKDNNNENKDPIYRCGRGIDMEDLRDKVLNVMTELSGFLDSDGACIEIEAVLHRAKGRALMDITDKLWDILKCCSSYKDLKQAFNYVFQCAAKCNIVNLPTNHNRLAEIINEVSQRRLAIPCLTGSEPLELLLEIGLEKLFKDYEFIFTECKMCSSKDLFSIYESEAKENDSPDVAVNVRKSIRSAVRGEATPSAHHRKTFLHSNLSEVKKSRDSDVMGFQNSKFNRIEVEAKLARLLQIHLALEHLLSIQINLNLDNVYVYICEQLLKRSPRSHKAINESLVDNIEIPMQPDNVIQHLEGKDPHSRKITLSSSNTFREVQSTFFYSVENIFPSNSAKCYQVDDKEMVKENVYYWWNYTKIKSKR